MRRWLSVIFLTAAAWGQTQSALEADPKGWKDILPKTSLKGWTRISIPPTKALDPVNQWKADPARRLLICDGKHGHDWLRYDRELGNVIFHVEFRFPKIEGGKGYNSGIFARNNADGSVWHQAQIGSANGGYLFGMTPLGGTRQRINLREQMKETRVKEAGEWNVLEVRAEGRKISVWVNGAVTSEFTECEVPKGYLGLEAEGYLIEFRNLKLKRLK